MPIRVKNIMAVEDVGGYHEALEKIFKSHFFAFGKVTSRHFVVEGLQEAW